MKNMFSTENPIIDGIYTITYSIYLCFLWILFSIPIITIGASTTAFYYTVHKVIRQKKGYIFKEFYKSFRLNFRQTTLVWIGMFSVCLVFLGDIWIIKAIQYENLIWSNAYVIFVIFLIIQGVFAIFVFSYFAMFKNSIRNTLKNAAILMVKHIGTSVLVLLILIFAVITIYLIPPLILIIPVVCMWFISILLDKIYLKCINNNLIKGKEQ